jgi:L-asparaginase / beta-aspartyl-peptidase
MILLASDQGETGVEATISLLRDGKDIISSIEAGIKSVEIGADTTSVGMNGLPNALGYVELDAGMMDGRTLKSGSVGALSGYAHPISIARKIMELLPHELLVGHGAELFADELGFSKDLRTKNNHACASPNNLSKTVNTYMKQCEGHDTVVFLGADMHNNFGVGASTSGIGMKYPGRVGDSAIVGAGFYAANPVGAAACTGIGEMSMRLATARTTINYMEMGLSVESAVIKSLEELLDLKDGLTGGITLFAINKDQKYFVGTIRNQSTVYFAWTDDCYKPRVCDPTIIT